MQEETFEFAQLLSGYLRDQLTEEEENHLMEILQKDESKRKILEYYKHTAPAQERLNYMNSLDLEAAWQKVNKRHSKKSQPNYKLRFFKYAAIFAIIIGSVSLWLLTNQKDDKIIPDITHNYKNDVLPGNNIAELILSDGKKILLDSGKIAFQEKNGTNLSGSTGKLIYANQENADVAETLYNTLIVPRAGTYTLQLPDGTRVWLNAMSELKFPLQFGSKERKVELKGEAYFEVVKDSRHPFKVTLDGSVIEVLGTSFNVCSYNQKSRTTLVEGSVKIQNSSRTGFLKPGEQSVTSNSELKISKGDIEKATAWKNGYFYFRNDGIEPVLEQISKWYDLKITYKAKVPQIHIGGTIRRKVKLSEALQMLKDVSDLSFEIDGKNLIVN